MAEGAPVADRPVPTLPPKMRLSRPELLLLDFDGVIVDSVAIKVDAYLRVYAGEPPEKLQAVLDYQRSHAGETRRLKFRHFEAELFRRPVTDEAIEALSREYTRLTYDAVLGCALIPGAREFLEAVHRTASLHIVSGTPLEELTDIVRRRGLSRYFASLHGAPATKPEAFRNILAATAVSPDRTLAIGDGTTEYDAAAALGIPFLGIVPLAERSPFPTGVPVIASLEGLGRALGLVDCALVPTAYEIKTR